MVAAFNFSKDGTFQFFYSYRDVDRNASGKFRIEENKLFLSSSKPPGYDFTITKQSKKGNGYSLKFEDPNSYLLNHILCIFYIAGEPRYEYTNDAGEVRIPIPHCDSIYAQHALFPDIYTRVKDINNHNTNFVLKLNPSLEQVSFKGIVLTIENTNELSCLPNYFLSIEGIRFVKN